MKKNRSKTERAVIGLLIPVVALTLPFEGRDRAKPEPRIADHWAVTLARVVAVLAAL